MKKLCVLGSFTLAGCIFLLSNANADSLSDFDLARLGISQAELNLTKVDPNNIMCDDCTQFVTFRAYENRKDFTDFPYYYQSGFYQMDFIGKEKTMVTLFGQKGFNTKKGFLVLVKLDNKPIRISDLDKMPSRQWITVKPGDDSEGAFDAYYYPYEGFQSDIASVKWGKWWEGESPKVN